MLAYTVGTDAYVVRQALLASLQGTVAAAWQSAAADFAGSSFATPAGVLATVDAAGRLAESTSTLADLASA